MEDKAAIYGFFFLFFSMFLLCYGQGVWFFLVFLVLGDAASIYGRQGCCPIDHEIYSFSLLFFFVFLMFYFS